MSALHLQPGLRCSRRAIHPARGQPALVGLGTAVPAMSMAQAEIESTMSRLWALQPSAQARWRRIIAGSGIERRHGVARPEEIIHQSTASRMVLYHSHAAALAERAIRNALQQALIETDQITDLIVVTCTGFSAPGVDVELIERLSLPATVHRSTIGFMGCFGAITGLRAAIGACSADPAAVALVVCVELCSLHMRADDDVQNQLASALFGDGAAAAVVCGSALGRQDAPAASVRLHRGASLLVPEGREWMTWTITDAGFAMTLSKHVPSALERTLPSFMSSACESAPRTVLIHPGGLGILDAAEKALGLAPCDGTIASREILRRHGNMSSATILFVLEEAMRRDDCRLPAILLAFGPGLTIESLVLQECQTNPDPLTR